MPKEITTEEIVRGLLRDRRFGFRDQGEYLRKGLCPACGEPELFIRKAMPWQAKCSRESKCGFEASTRELLPELFADYARRFAPTEANPNATADAYLKLDRGFDLTRIRGWYEQQAYQIPGTAGYCPTIRFYLDDKRTRYWERLIDKTKKDGQKANFGGKRKPDKSLYRGDAWSPPGQALGKGDKCFIVEGIFHAMALVHSGRKAAAAFSCNNFPSGFIKGHKGKGITWVLALDGDAAGRRYTLRHAEKLRAMDEEVAVCLLPKGKQDWDDLYRVGRITDKFVDWCLYEGRLFTAKSVIEKAWQVYCRRRRHKYVIDHDNALWAIGVDSAFEADAEAAGVEIDSPDALEHFKVKATADRICNLLPRFLYMERDDILDEQRYVFQVDYKSGGDHLVALEGSHIATPEAFHKALLNTTRGGQFHGTAGNFKQLTRKWMDERMLTVTSVPFTGYDRDAGAWVFPQKAYHNGREVGLNEHGYFEIGRTGIKSSLKSVRINTGGDFDPGWLDDFRKVFHWQGLVALAWWLGSLFAQQIRARHRSYPFFELTGEAGAGKSTLLEFLWKCTGRDDYEGFDAMKATHAGRRRAFNQISNMPVVVIESDRDNGDRDSKVKQFNFDECKVLFDGRGTGTLGVARRNNEVEEHLFQGALAISQNAQVDGSEALLSRIVHCHADKAHHTFDTRETARWFERQTSDTVGGFLRKALIHEKRILEAYDRAFGKLETDFSKTGLRTLRVIKCHAQVAALGHALGVIFPAMDKQLTDDLTGYILLRAQEREERLQADHPIVGQFWETYRYLNEGTGRNEGWLDHSSDPDTIAVNLNQFREACVEHGQELMDFRQLKKLLPDSRTKKFRESNKTVWSASKNKSLRCWIFEK